MRGGAQWLNDHRKKWVKKLECPYIVLGLFGIIVSINRMEIMDGRTGGLDLWGPLILTPPLLLKWSKFERKFYEWDNPESLRFEVNT
jgi:hypothetical protein